jgi:hypothetical protein
VQHGGNGGSTLQQLIAYPVAMMLGRAKTQLMLLKCCHSNRRVLLRADDPRPDFVGVDPRHGVLAQRLNEIGKRVPVPRAVCEQAIGLENYDANYRNKPE